MGPGRIQRGQSTFGQPARPTLSNDRNEKRGTVSGEKIPATISILPLEKRKDWPCHFFAHFDGLSALHQQSARKLSYEGQILLTSALLKFNRT